MRKMLLAALVLLAVPASANAATTIVVNDHNDAPLESSATTCESTDAGGCTLRAAVELANDTGEVTTIELPEGTYSESLGTLSVKDGATISIVGAGSAHTAIEGDKDGSVLEVQSGGALTLEGVTVEDGGVVAGGGARVDFDGSLRVRASTFTHDYAFVGGGIYAEPRSAVVIEESDISGNASRYDGGGLFKATTSECPSSKVAAKRGAAAATLQAPLGEGLTVVRTTIEGNLAEEGEGGGVAAANGICGDAQANARHKAVGGDAQLLDEEEGSILIEQSTIAHNEAFPEEDGPYGGYGGGVYVEAEADDPIVDSTIADNYATYEGGGVYVWSGSETLVSDTVAYNTIEPEEKLTARPSDVQNNAGPHGANLSTHEPEDEDGFEAGVISLRNTIVAEQSGSEVNNCSGYVESLIPKSGYNLDYPSTPIDAPFDSCGMSEAEDDLVGTDPKLDPSGLQNNGGPTQTIALEASSPAIGYVPFKEDCELEGVGPALELESGKISPVDQRSEPRPGIAGKGCDIGAYEYQEPPKTVVSTTKEEPKVASGGVLSVKVTSPVQCASKRDIVIHIQNVKQLGIVSAVVSIDGKKRRTLTGKRLRTAIDLIGLPKGTFTVEIKAKTRSGKTLHGQRVYHTCHTKLPGHKYLPL